MDRDQWAVLWPQFALEIAVDGAILWCPTDDQLAALARRAAEPDAVLPTADAHFVVWLRDRTPVQIVDQRIARVQSNRDLARRPGWTLDLAVFVDDQPVGIQSLSGFDQWPGRRVVGTTSWLLAPFQGRGIGTRSRAAVLDLAFDFLRAESAKSWVLQDNHASVGVSVNLGYVLAGTHDITECGQSYVERIYELDRASWLESPARQQYPCIVRRAEPLVALLME